MKVLALINAQYWIENSKGNIISKQFNASTEVQLSGN